MAWVKIILVFICQKSLILKSYINKLKLKCLRFVLSSVGIHWMRSVLLRSVDFFSVYKIISMGLRHHILGKDSVLTWYLLLLSIFVKAHSHWRCHVLWTTHASHTLNIMLIVVHFKYFLLLSSQVLGNLLVGTIGSILTTSIHYGKSHGSWNENIILAILATTWCFYLWLVHEIIGVLHMMWWLTLCWRLV